MRQCTLILVQVCEELTSLVAIRRGRLDLNEVGVGRVAGTIGADGSNAVVVSWLKAS